MIIIYSGKFLRSFRKLPSVIRDEYRDKEIIFKLNQYDPRLRTHKLKGRDDWSFLVTYKIRVIFVFVKGAIVLVNIGDHSLYRKK